MPDAEAHGAAVLRRLDVEKFRSFLKRKWQDEKGQPQDALLASQTTLERKQKRKLELLLPTYDTISVWPEKVRKALESGLATSSRT